MGYPQSPEAQAVLSYFLALHGFQVSLFAIVDVNSGLERCISAMLAEPCALDEQTLKPYMLSSLLLEVSHASDHLANKQ